MILQFGKYKGYNLSEVPGDYLQWMIDNNNKTNGIYTKELKRRDEEEKARELAAEASMDWLDRIIKAGYRELAMRHHPDQGGTNADMKALNAAHEALKQARRSDNSKSPWEDVK